MVGWCVMLQVNQPYNKHSELHPSPSSVLLSSHFAQKIRPSPQISRQAEFLSTLEYPFLQTQEFPLNTSISEAEQSLHVTSPKVPRYALTQPLMSELSKSKQMPETTSKRQSHCVSANSSVKLVLHSRQCVLFVQLRHSGRQRSHVP